MNEEEMRALIREAGESRILSASAAKEVLMRILENLHLKERIRK